jgi:uncharacterized membrane protein
MFPTSPAAARDGSNGIGGALIGGIIGGIVVGIMLLLLIIVVIVAIGRKRNKKYDGSNSSGQNGGMVLTNAVYGIVYTT